MYICACVYIYVSLCECVQILKQQCTCAHFFTTCFVRICALVCPKAVVCPHVFMCTHTQSHTHTHARTHARTHTDTHTHTQIRTHACTYLSMHIHTLTRALLMHCLQFTEREDHQQGGRGRNVRRKAWYLHPIRHCGRDQR